MPHALIEGTQKFELQQHNVRRHAPDNTVAMAIPATLKTVCNQGQDTSLMPELVEIIANQTHHDLKSFADKNHMPKHLNPTSTQRAMSSNEDQAIKP